MRAICKYMNKISMKNLIIAAIIVGVLVIPGLIVYLIIGTTGIKPLSSDDLGKKVLTFINTSLLSGQATASLSSIVKEDGLYKMTIKISDQESIVYASLDGKILFPSYIPIGESSSTAATPTEIPKTDKSNAELFVMSFCPYGNEAEDLIKPVIDLLGNKINLTLHYIITKTNSTYSSLHGDQELNQDVRELCVAKYQKDKFWAFVEAINKNCTAQNADSCWEKTAGDLGINTQKIKDCQSSEGNSLLDAEIQLTNQYQVTGSPQLFVNGVEDKGDRTSDGYKTGICSGFTTEPSECQTKLSTSGGSASGGCQ